MPAPSLLTIASFCGVVFVVAFAIAPVVRRALGAGPLVPILAAYLAVPAVLAITHRLDRYDPLPAPALIVVLALTIVTVAVALSPWGGRIADAAPLGAIVALQSFRIVVEWVLHRLYAEGVVPVQMTWSGRNFDVVSGITGLALGAWLLSGRPARRGTVWAWNALGLGLLINIVAVAVLSTPVPFRKFTEGPPNLLPSTFPFVWLPSFLVQVALGSHLLLFRKLRGR